MGLGLQRDLGLDGYRAHAQHSPADTGWHKHAQNKYCGHVFHDLLLQLPSVAVPPASSAQIGLAVTDGTGVFTTSLASVQCLYYLTVQTCAQGGEMQ